MEIQDHRDAAPLERRACEDGQALPEAGVGPRAPGTVDHRRCQDDQHRDVAVGPGARLFVHTGPLKNSTPEEQTGAGNNQRVHDQRGPGLQDLPGDHRSDTADHG